ncbi:MAG TPA: biotin/lipoyl-binding carrier protein [Burkholderiaceae bacterium]|nr:biotin/lipoyl-binding carrier protein [Burkholderiaceae bacterium]
MKAHTIRSEVTGTVWKIVAGVGDAVAADQELLILESMKMEIPTTASVAGTVQRILVAEGDVVEEGQDLMVIEVRVAL